MKVNGEAIYGSRAVLPSEYENLRFTSNPDGTIYMIYLAEKEENAIPSSVFVDGFQPSNGSIIALLGRKGSLRWRQEGTGFRITIPASVRKNPPCDHAWTFKVNMFNEDKAG